MRSSRSLYAVLFSASLAISLGVTPAYCVDCSPALQSEERARQTNSPTDWLAAGNVWLGCAKFGQQDSGDWRPNEKPGHLQMARRAVACFQKSFDLSHDDPNQTRGIEFDSRLRSLLQGYDMCARLDPNNPLWYYLAGEQLAGLGHYLEAEANLKMAVRLGGGQPAGQRAGTLLAHIGPFVKRDDADHSKDSPQFGGILQNQRGSSNAHLDSLQANYDRIHGLQSHGNAAQYRTEGNTGN